MKLKKILKQISKDYKNSVPYAVEGYKRFEELYQKQNIDNVKKVPDTGVKIPIPEEKPPAVKKIREYEVEKCMYDCPFFGYVDRSKKCDHPYWGDDCYEGMIITHENSKHGIPDECPLRNFTQTEEVKIVKLKRGYK